MMNVRSIRFVTATELSSLRTVAHNALGQWTAHWFGAGTAASTDCAAMDLPPVDQGAASMWLCCKTGDADLWLDTAAVSAIGSSLLGSGADAALGASIARSAAGDLLKRLAANDSATLCDAPAPQHLWQAGRCVVAVAITLSGKSHKAALKVLVEKHAPVQAASRADATRAPLLPVKALVHDQLVEVEVSLGQVEVELGILRSLAIGDVLRLDRALDAGADIRVCGNRVGCVGFLGAHEGQRAVALARA